MIVVCPCKSWSCWEEGEQDIPGVGWPCCPTVPLSCCPTVPLPCCPGGKCSGLGAQLPLTPCCSWSASWCILEAFVSPFWQQHVQRHCIIYSLGMTPLVVWIFVIGIDSSGNQCNKSVIRTEGTNVLQGKQWHLVLPVLLTNKETTSCSRFCLISCLYIRFSFLLMISVLLAI